MILDSVNSSIVNPRSSPSSMIGPRARRHCRPHIRIICKLLEIVPVGSLSVLGRERTQLIDGDETLEVRDFLRATDQQPLAMLDRADEFRGFEQSVVRPGVEPGVTAAELHHV